MKKCDFVNGFLVTAHAKIATIRILKKEKRNKNKQKQTKKQNSSIKFNDSTSVSLHALDDGELLVYCITYKEAIGDVLVHHHTYKNHHMAKTVVYKLPM